MFVLVDGREKSFRIEGEKEILFYLDFPENMNMDEAKERLEKENDGMNFYHIIEEKEGKEMNFASIVTNSYGCEIDYKVAVSLMDDEIREELHNELAPCEDQLFFDEYAKKHFEKFGEVWELAKENPCY